MLVSLEGVLLSTFVLIKQNRMSKRADRRAHLDLQVNLLTEKEVTKVIQMLEAISDHSASTARSTHEARELGAGDGGRRTGAGTEAEAAGGRIAHAAIIGGGPAGLIAAERLAGAGVAVTVYDRMRSPGRKFLLAGRGGLNLTHSEPLDRFLARYGPARAALAPRDRRLPAGGAARLVRGAGPADLRRQQPAACFPRRSRPRRCCAPGWRRLARLGRRVPPGHRWLGWDERARCASRRRTAR